MGGLEDVAASFCPLWRAPPTRRSGCLFLMSALKKERNQQQVYDIRRAALIGTHSISDSPKSLLNMSHRRINRERSKGRKRISNFHEALNVSEWKWEEEDKKIKKSACM